MPTAPSPMALPHVRLVKSSTRRPVLQSHHVGSKEKKLPAKVLGPLVVPVAAAQNRTARRKSRAITNIQQLARMPPRLPRPHMSRCQYRYQYRPAPAVAVCCCDHACVLRPKVKANCGSLWSCLQASCSHADESSTQALPKGKLSSGSRHHQRTRISRELT